MSPSLSDQWVWAGAQRYVHDEAIDRPKRLIRRRPRKGRPGLYRERIAELEERVGILHERLAEAREIAFDKTYDDTMTLDRVREKLDETL